MSKRKFSHERESATAGREVRSEIDFHLEMRTRELMERGVAEDVARRMAREAFGNVDSIADECTQLSQHRIKHDRRTRMLNGFTQDIRFAVRTLGRNRGFTIAAILTLALGIGANTALFSVINSVVLKPLPYPQGDELVILRQDAQLVNATDIGFSVPEMNDYRQQNRSFEHIVEHHEMWFNLLGRKEPERVQTGVVSWNYFEMLGVDAARGRTFATGDEHASAEPVLVLSHDYWKRSFAGDTAVIGQKVEMNDRMHTIIGVLPAVPQYGNSADVYMTSNACPFRSAPDMANTRDMRMVGLYGRLKDGVSVEAAQQDLSTITARLSAAFPEAYPANRGLTANVRQLRDELTREARPTLYVLLGTAALVLLLACANVANLTTARLLKRGREMAVRTALGAGRVRLLRQLVTESAVLAFAGGALGLGIAALCLEMLTQLVRRFTPRAAEIGIDPTVLAFAAGLSILTGFIFGVIPALASRRDVSASLKEGSEQSTGSAGRERLRRLMITTQVALSVTLLVGAGLTLRSLLKLQGVETGIESRNVLTMHIDLNWSRYTNNAERAAFYEKLLARLAEAPGITSSAVSLTFPLNERGPANGRVVLEGEPLRPGEIAPQVSLRSASANYFSTIGIDLVDGRFFRESENLAQPPVVIVSREMARKFFPQGSPIGRRVSFDNGQTWRTVVGLVEDARQSLNRQPEGEVYFPVLQLPSLSATVLIKTAGAPMAMAQAMREAVYSIDPQQPVYSVRTLDAVRAESLAPPRLVAILLSLFACVALAITATGITGMIAFSVGQRTREIGIRMALGAERGMVLGMVYRQGMLPVVVGIGVGVAGSLALSRVMNSLLFEVGATDPLTFAGVACLLFTVASVACLLPARQATRVSPMNALRHG